MGKGRDTPPDELSCGKSNKLGPSPEDTKKQKPKEVIVKKEPVERLTTPKPQPEIIVLDDTPPRASKRSAAKAAGTTAPTIKSEPLELGATAMATPTIEQAASEGGPTKKIKLEPGADIPKEEDDPQLLRLKKEEEQLEEELLQAQRIAELIRRLNDRTAKIAEIEARRTATPGRDQAR